jgi:hypothetical protein
MTKEQQRIAIAKACGWNSKSDFQINANLRYHATWVESENRGFFIPDYLNDLNAMHEAENSLLSTGKLEEDYYYAIDRSFRATAAQRAEAFLRTIGKWEDK